MHQNLNINNEFRSSIIFFNKSWDFKRIVSNSFTYCANLLHIYCMLFYLVKLC